MHIVKTPTHPTTRRSRSLVAYAATLAMTVGALQSLAHADDRIPNIPAALQVPSGNQVFFAGHASGVQIYTCTATGWTFVAPAATLLDHGPVTVFHKVFQGHEVAIHFTGPTWQANDGSTVTGAKVASANAPSGNAIPWLLVRTVVTTMGPQGGDTLSDTTYVQRLNTTGGLAPATGCDAQHIGAYAGVPYTADYFFYEAD
jgi:hypothetical protein